MRDLPSTDLDLAFITPGTPMFSDVIGKLQDDIHLSETRRRDLISGLRRVAKALGRPTQDVPCDARWLQKRLGKIAPAALGLTAKTWQNAVSDARTALAHVGQLERKNHLVGDFTPEWQALWRLVLESKDKSIQAALSRFVRFLSCEGVAPDDVRDVHAQAYYEALLASEISKAPVTAFRAAVNGWNLAGRRIADWPKARLSLPSRQVKYVMSLEAFPDSFRLSYDAMCRRFSEVDPFAETGRAAPVRPSTLTQYRLQMVRFASELVHSGVEIDTLTDVTVLLDPPLAERGLRQMLKRNGNETNRCIAAMSSLLRNLGRILDLPEKQRSELARLARRTATKKQKGMTTKNRGRLMILQDDSQTLRLLNLPEALLRKASRDKRAFYRGLAQEEALAIAILLVCPIRMKNLSSIELGRSLQRPGDGRAYLVFDESETKTEQPIQFEVPQDVLRMIDRHLKTRDVSLCPPGTPWLFPRRDGLGPIEPSQLSTRLTRRIRRETGLEMNAHLFRHFAVMLWLDANPGSYEAARHFLGHSTVSHTINMYSGLEGSSAIKAFSDLVTTKKGRKR